MATNLDLTVPTPYGAAPGNGSLVGVVATAVGRGPDEVAGKPLPGAFTEAAATAGSSAPLVVGDRLDTDLEGARAARMPGLLVLTGVTGVTELLAAPADQRPDYVGRDLWSMLQAHPEASADGGTGTCRDAVVTAHAGPDAVELAVVRPGDDALDLLRAAAVAVWAVADAARDASSGPRHVLAGPVIEAVLALEPGAAWAR
jgi:hypothetical protein